MSKGTKVIHFCARHFFDRLRMAYTKTFTVELMDVSGSWNLNEKKVEELLYVLVFVGLLEVKYDPNALLDLQQLDGWLNN